MDGDVKKIKHIVPVVPKFIIPAEGFISDGLDGAELIPVDLGGRLVPPSISINELGKQLLKASIEGNIDEIKMLMNKGAPFTADWLGTSPLHFAAQNNHLEVCEVLLRAGISKDARTKVDRTPLHIATYEGNIEIVKCLLRNKADIDCKDLLAMTPLHWAAQNCHADIVELLIRHGAQRDVVNKFNLTPLDIALQCNRHDVTEIITLTMPDEDIAVQHLTLEMNELESSNDSVIYPPVETSNTEPNSPIPLETVLLEDIDSENSIDPERLHINQEGKDTAIKNYASAEVENNTLPEETDSQDCKFSESIKLLQQHGITMLPADDTNILSSILETGHSVVLTEVGKQVLNSTKPIQSTSSINKAASKIRTFPLSAKPKKVITMTPQEFLAMTMSQDDLLKQINGKFVSSQKPAVKRIVMRKNKVVPITNANTMKIHKQENLSDVETLMKQLIDTRKLVEEYKQKFLKKEAEAEKYKQLLLIAQSKNIC